MNVCKQRYLLEILASIFEIENSERLHRLPGLAYDNCILLEWKYNFVLTLILLFSLILFDRLQIRPWRQPSLSHARSTRTMTSIPLCQ